MKEQEDIRNVFRMNLQPTPFSLIKSGRKTVEMRLYDDRRKNIMVGDIIIFTNLGNGEEIMVEVKQLRRFSFFERLYAYYPKERLGYKENEVANPDDMQQYYSKELIDKYGTLAIEIELLNEAFN